MANRAGPVVPPTFTQTVQVITPELAQEYLKRNTGNRALSRANLANLIARLERGEFGFTGDSVKFDWDGNLIDGQHRLELVVATGTPVPMVVQRGLDPAVFKYLDQGRKRSLGDALSVNKVPNYNGIAAIVSLAYAYDNAPEGRLHLAPSIDDGLLLYYRHKAKFDEAVGWSRSLARNWLGGKISGWFYFVTDGRGGPWLHKVITAELLQPKTGAMLLFKRGQDRDKTQATDVRVLNWIALLTKAYAIDMEGRRVPAQLSWRSSGDAPEPFPRLSPQLAPMLGACRVDVPLAAETAQPAQEPAPPPPEKLVPRYPASTPASTLAAFI